MVCCGVLCYVVIGPGLVRMAWMGSDGGREPEVDREEAGDSSAIRRNQSLSASVLMFDGAVN